MLEMLGVLAEAGRSGHGALRYPGLLAASWFGWLGSVPYIPRAIGAIIFGKIRECLFVG